MCPISDNIKAMKISTNFQDPLIKIVPDFFYPIKSGPFTLSDFVTVMIAESLSVNASLVVKNSPVKGWGGLSKMSKNVKMSIHPTNHP